MPLYEYSCPQCGRFEVLQRFADQPLTQCPTCANAVQRLISAPAIQFKGSGWYVTDYARKGGSSPDAKASGEKAATSSTTKGTESQSPAAGAGQSATSTTTSDSSSSK